MSTTCRYCGRLNVLVRYSDGFFYCNQHAPQPPRAYKRATVKDSDYGGGPFVVDPQAIVLEPAPARAPDPEPFSGGGGLSSGAGASGSFSDSSSSSSSDSGSSGGDSS